MATKFTSFTPLEEAAPTFTSFTPIEEPEAGGARGLSALVPSIMRGGRGLVSLGGDVLPAMVGKAFGAEDYAKKQLEEAKTYGEETEKLYPAAVGSYKNINDLGDFGTYAVEAVGEVIPSLLPSLFTGGAAAIAGRGAVAAAKMAAEKAAVAQAAKGATAEAVKDAAMKAGVDAANKVALKYQAVGAVTGSAAQNVPDVFQNVYEKTGKMDLGTAIVAGGFNAALDAVLPVTLLRKANIGGISPQEIGAAWYKRMGKGAATGFATEGGTEAVQEMSSAAAEKFVDNNLNFFTEKNFERFMDAGLKGGIGGGAITSATDVAAGKGPDKGAKKPPPAPTGFTSFTPITPVTPATPPTAKQQARQDAVAQRAQQLEEQSGITADDAVRIAEDDIAAEEAKITGLTTKDPNTRVKARAVELIDKQGMKPEEAYATALQQVQDEIESDVLAKEQGAQDVTGTKPGTSGKRTTVASKPAAGAPAAGPEASAGVGVVSPAGNAGVPNVGKAAQPAAIAQKQQTASGGLENLLTMGAGLTDSLYGALFNAHSSGSIRVAGIDDPLLIAAKEDGVRFNNPDEIKVYANQPGMKERTTSIAQKQRVKKMLATGKTPEQIQAQYPNLDINALMQEDKGTVAPAPVEEIKPPVVEAALTGTEKPTPIVQSSSIGNMAPEYLAKIITPARGAIQAGNFKPVTLKDGRQVNLVVSQDEENAGGRVIAFDQKGQEVGQLGFYKVTTEEDSGYNPNAFVDEGFRRQGLATALYDLAEASGAKIPSLEQQGQIRSKEGQALREARAGKKLKAPVAPASIAPASIAPAPIAPKVDIAAAQAATDPAEIQKHLADIETEGATLLSKDGRFPKKDTPKRVRLDEIGVLKRDLTAKLQPAVAPVVTAPVAEALVVETPVEKNAEERIAARAKANVEANQKAVAEKAKTEAEAKAKADRRAAEAKDEEQEQALRDKAEAEVDAGPIGEALSRIESGDRVETKAQLRPFMFKLEKNGVLDDISDIQEALSDREQSADDALDIMRDQLDTARDEAINERVDELREEAEQETETKTEPKTETKTEPKTETKTEPKTEKSDDWASFIDEIEQEVNQEIAEPEAILFDTPFDQTQRGPWKARGVEGRNIGAELTAELAEEKQKRRGFAQTEAAAKAKEKQERATKEETAEAAETEPDEAAKARAGAVDVVNRSLEIVGALQEVAESTDFSAGTRTNARKYLAEIARANNENEAPEGSLEPAFLFLVDLASKPRFIRTGINKSLPSIGKAKVQAIVDLVASRWGNAPTVVVADNINDAVVPAELQKADAEAKAKGATGVPAGVFYQGKVYIFADQMKSTAETVRTLLHESLGHYGLRGVFGEDLKPILQLVAKNFKTEMDALAKKYGLDFSKEADVMEAAEEILTNIAQTKPTMGVMQRAIAAVRRFLRKIGFDVKLSNKDLIANYILPARAFVENRRIDRAVGGAPGFSRTTEEENLTPEQSKVLKDTIRTQEEIDKAVAEAKFKFEKSAKGQKAAKGVSLLQMATNPSKVIPAMRDLWKRATSLQRNLFVKAPPTSFLVDWAGNDIPELKNTYKLLQQMGGMTEQLLNAAGELTNEVQRAFQADSTLRGKLDELTSVATLAKVDPGKIDTAERSDVLDKAWKDLGPEGQRVYTRIRNHFDSLSKYLSKLLDDQVNSLGVSAEAKTNLMKKIRATFEKGSRISPYFALVREGDFWLSMGSGDTRTFFMAETAAERDRVAREFAAERVKRKDGESEAAFEKRIDKTLDELYNDGANGGKNGFDKGDDISSLRKKPYSQGQSKMLTDVFDAIDSTDFTDPEAGGLLKDAVYQTFLETMPDQSFRQQFIHREGVAGFRVDVLQNTAHISARMATQLARIKYSPLLRNSLSAAKDSIRGRPAFDPFVAEMAARVDSSLAPREKSVAASVAGGLNKAAFIYYLSGASSALLQPLSIFQTGMPVLARYGVFKAGREMSRMLKVWSQFGVYKTNADGSKSWVAPSILNAKDTTPLERKAYRAAAELGLFSSTQASSVFEYKATPTEELKGPKEKFVRGTVDALVLGGLMNSSERMSREAMFMTSFRLNMEQHGNFTRAVSQATYDTNEALGDYSEASRPAFMKAPVGKVLTQFMMYPLHVTMFLAKNFKEMIKPMNGRSRAEASYKFFGTLGTTYILAGATGLPMFSAAMGILGAAWEELKDDDWDESMRSMGFEAWFTTVWLHDQLGATEIGGVSLSDLLLRGPANALTGIDIASRTSMNNLWTRESKEQKTIRESATAMALEKAGPAANMILSVADGIDAATQGDYAKAVKKWAPAGFRNFVNAHELYTEGAKDNKGAQLMSEDKFTTGVLIAQTIGFRSDLLADTQSTAFRVIGAQQKIFNEQTRLLDNLDREFRNGNDVRYGKQLDKIADFNVRYPSFAIGTDQIINSLETRMERRGTAYMGVVPTEKNFMLLDSLRHISQRVSEAPSKNTQP